MSTELIEYAKRIGTLGRISSDGWIVAVEIVGLRRRYGQAEYQIRQTVDQFHSVTQWIVADRVNFDD